MTKTKNQKTIEVYWASDYVGVENGKHKFYYGYEETFCPLHGKNIDCGCDHMSWCFVASVDDKEVMRLTTSELQNLVDDNPKTMMDYLLIGIAEYLRRYAK